MKKYVLSENVCEFVLEPRSNYYAYVQDVHKKMRFNKRDFASVSEVIDYAAKYLSIPVEAIERPMY